MQSLYIGPWSPPSAKQSPVCSGAVALAVSCAPVDCTSSCTWAASRLSCWFSVASWISGRAFVAVARCTSSLTCLESSLQKQSISQKTRVLRLFRIIVVVMALALSVRFVAYVVSAGAAAAFDFLRHVNDNLCSVPAHVIRHIRELCKRPQQPELAKFGIYL